MFSKVIVSYISELLVSLGLQASQCPLERLAPVQIYDITDLVIEASPIAFDENCRSCTKSPKLYLNEFWNRELINKFTEYRDNTIFLVWCPGAAGITLCRTCSSHWKQWERPELPDQWCHRSALGRAFPRGTVKSEGPIKLKAWRCRILWPWTAHWSKNLIPLRDSFKGRDRWIWPYSTGRL